VPRLSEHSTSGLFQLPTSTMTVSHEK